jgi:hypothetical protein
MILWFRYVGECGLELAVELGLCPVGMEAFGISGGMPVKCDRTRPSRAPLSANAILLGGCHWWLRALGRPPLQAPLETEPGVSLAVESDREPPP